MDLGKDVSDLWARIKTAVEGEAVKVEDTFTELEQKLLPAFSELVKKIESTIGSQGVTILEQGLSDIVTVVENGGSIAPTIAALIPQVTGQVKDDLKQDAATAAHGAAELIVASMTTPTIVPTPTPAPAPAPAPNAAA